MGLNRNTASVLQGYLPGRILALGYPMGLEHLDLSGSKLTAVDIVPHFGVEQVFDLSYLCDLPEADVVLDHGTIEHCSNPVKAFINAAKAVSYRGVAFHHSPVSMANHGYWNFNPTWFVDFYTANGFDVERLDLTDGQGNIVSTKHGILDPRTQFPPDHLVLCVARRVKILTIRIPTCEAKWQESGLPLAILQRVRRAREWWEKKAKRL